MDYLIVHNSSWKDLTKHRADAKARYRVQAFNGDVWDFSSQPVAVITPEGRTWVTFNEDEPRYIGCFPVEQNCTGYISLYERQHRFLHWTLNEEDYVFHP